MVILLSIPTFLDLVSSVLSMISLSMIPLSVAAMLRGSIVVFTAIIKQLLGDKLDAAAWAGTAIITAAVLVVGAVSVATDDSASASGGGSAIIGITLGLLSVLVMTVQGVVEEKLMSEHHAPALRLVGVMGLVGFCLTGGIVYPASYFFVPGADNGRMEARCGRDGV